jgi:hypothetical protein
VVGNTRTNELVSIKRVAMKKAVTKVALEFNAPAKGTSSAAQLCSLAG